MPLLVFMFVFTYLHTVGVQSFVHWSHSHSHTHTHTLGRISLHEGSTCRCDLHLTKRSIRIGPTPMHPVGFEPTIPTSERPHTHAVDRTAKILLKVSWSSLLPLHLVVFSFYSSSYILLFYFLAFSFFIHFFVLSLFRWFFYLPSVRFSLISLFNSHFPRRHTHTYKKQQTGISIIFFELYTGSTKKDKGSLPKNLKKKNLENNFM
jgi:hypothetical protein